MRLSTNTIYSIGTAGILNQQARMSNIGQQLASGHRINKPSDDPTGAASALELTQSSEINAQYASTRSTAQQQMSDEENQLNQVTNALDSAKQSLVQAQNGTLNNADRQALSDKLNEIYDQMLSAANARDSDGRYLFSGSQVDKPAFAGTTGSLSYQGDNVTRDLQVSSSRQMQVSDTGARVFASVDPNAEYVGTASSSNQGTATYSSVDVADAGSPDFGDTFSLEFATVDGATKYSVVDQTSGKTVSQGNYVSGQSIAIGKGLTTTIQGTPVDGDSFTFARGRSTDSNILNALANVASALSQPADTPQAQAKLTNALSRASQQVDNAQEQVSSVSSGLGSRLAGLDQLNNLGADLNIANQTALSSVVDVDMVSAISSFSLSRVALQAAEETFSSMQKMSFFNVG